VASDILGVSGRAMLAALVQGETDARALAGLAKGRLRKKQPQLVAALTGRITPGQRTLLGHQLAHVEYLERAIAGLDALIATLLAPYQAEAERLRSIVLPEYSYACDPAKLPPLEIMPPPAHSDDAGHPLPGPP
jgi:transposase